MSAPIAVFAYNRPDHLRRTLCALVACDGFADAPVTVFCDGPRAPDQAEAVAAARDVAREILGSGADLRLAASNRGLARSVIGGVTELVNLHGRVIVVEDDFDLAPIFLRYMNDTLDRYAADERVYQVSGHMFDVPAFRGRETAVILPFITTWGWGTWARAWSAFDPQATGWQKVMEDRALRRQFNLGGVYDYAEMLRRQMEGRRDSWGIRWYWSTFRAQGLAVFPPATLVRNTGQDGSGTHGAGKLRHFSNGALDLSWPDRVILSDAPAGVDAADLAAVRAAIWRQNGGWLGWVADKAKRCWR